jgi:hypothetical protein
MNRQALTICTVLLAIDCTDGVNQPSHEIQVRHQRDMVYELDVIRKADRAVVQIIEVRNGIDPSEPGATELVDIDGDGHPDLRVLGGEARGEAWHKVWVYDPEEEGFVWSHTTEQ